MKGETIVCYAPRAWRSLWRETQQVMSRLAQDNRVIYIDPGRDTDEPLIGAFRRSLPNLWRQRFAHVTDSLLVLSGPPEVPIGRGRIPRVVLNRSAPVSIALNAAIRSAFLKRTLSRLDIRTPILWLSSPYDVRLVGEFGEKIAVYYNYDEFSEMSGNRPIRELIRRYDRELCRRAAIVFCTSRAQYEVRSRVARRCAFVPNGVDYDLFAGATAPDLPRPAELSGLKGRLIGFAGWLGYHIDVELLDRLASAFPDDTIVLVGPDDLPNDRLTRHFRSRSNVYFAGRKDVEELPGYLGYFDCALMPWRLDGHVRYAYPLKLHEYLAAGRKVVATDLPELAPFGDVVRICRSHDEFIAGVKAALSDDDSHGIVARQQVAIRNTWDIRVREIHNALDPLLAGSGDDEPHAK